MAKKLTRAAATRLLLKDVFEQFERREHYYRLAGGRPSALRGNLVCYLPYELLRATRRAIRRRGTCVCGRPIAWHFDGQNRKVDCTRAKRRRQ